MKPEHLTGLAVTAGLHLTLLAFLLGNVSGHRKHPEPPRHIIETHLVVPVKAGAPDGNPRIKSARKIRPRRRRLKPRPTQRVRKVHSSRAPKEEAPEKTIEQEAAIEQLAEKELADEENPRQLVPKGQFGDSKTGLDDPCVLQFSKAVAAYKAVIQSKVSGFKRPSFISAELAENLVTDVRVTFDASGRVVSVRTVKSSGNPRFDRAAESFVRKIGSFGPPPKCVLFDRKTGEYKSRRSFRVRLRAR